MPATGEHRPFCCAHSKSGLVGFRPLLWQFSLSLCWSVWLERRAAFATDLPSMKIQPRLIFVLLVAGLSAAGCSSVRQRLDRVGFDHRAAQSATFAELTPP